MSKRIVFCGDDFGMNADIDEGMIALSQQGRLSAVSCMSLGPTFRAHAPRLDTLNIDIGLHLNFTEALSETEKPLPSLSRLILRAYTGRIEADWVEAQLVSQFDAFEAAFGRMPDYVDGHQHVHQLPGIRLPLLTLLRHRYPQRQPWLRCTLPGRQRGLSFKTGLKAQIIGALGASALRRVAGRWGWQMNRRLLGVYDFQGGTQRYATLLQQWLANAREGDLLMCHPAARGSQSAMSRQRYAEFEVLKSAEMGAWLDRHAVQISRLTPA